MYYIRHLINTRNGKKLVDLKQILSEHCKKCNKEVPQIFYGKDNNSVYSVDAIYKYTVKDIEGEASNTIHGCLPKACQRKGCGKFRY